MSRSASWLRFRLSAKRVVCGCADVDDDATVAPLAVVCEFPSGAPEEALEEAHPEADAQVADLGLAGRREGDGAG